MKFDDYLLIYLIGIPFFQFLVTWGILIEYPLERHGDSVFALLMTGVALLLIFMWPVTAIAGFLFVVVPLFMRKKKNARTE